MCIRDRLYSQVPDDFDDKITLYEVGAAVNAINGDFEKATKLQKRVLKLVKKFDLPVDGFESQLTSYQSKKKWSEKI